MTILDAQPDVRRTKIFRRDSQVVSREILGERILVPISCKAGDIGRIYVLNEVGAYSWTLFDGIKSLRQIASILVDEYEVSIERAESDLFNFADRLTAIGALEDVTFELSHDTGERLF